MKKTLAQRLKEDKRIQEGKTLILQAIEELQDQCSLKGPDKDLEKAYQKSLEDFAQLRGASLWYPYLGSGFGKGALVELTDGSVKYDFINGIGVHVGHGIKPLIETNIDAAIEDTVMQGHLQQTEASLKLSHLLIEASSMDHCLLTTSGAMACENAIKMALQKQAPKQRILAFENCFMGRTMSLAQVTDKPHLRDGLPLNLPVDYLPFYDYKDPEGSLKKTIKHAERIIKRYPNSHAVMCMELVQGEGGFYPGTPDFFKGLIQFLKSHNIAILVDEVQTFGRFPEILASKHFGIIDDIDILAIGKITQVCATLFSKTFTPRAGLVSQTFTGSTSSIYSATCILETLLSSEYSGREGKIKQIGDYFRNKLEKFSEENPHLIKGPYGTGTLLAFTPLEGVMEKTLKILKELFSEGLIAFICGASPARIRFLPPIIGIEKEDVDKSCEILFNVLKKQ
jgi:acetylornithine/N-succinyldiaminopimelate aminotransferase